MSRPVGYQSEAARPGPTLVVFDLDACCWEPEMYELRGGGAPFKQDSKEPNNTLTDKAGHTVHMLGDTASVWAECHARQQAGELLVGVASRCDDPAWGHKCLKKFLVAPGISMMDVVTEARCEIHGGNTQAHLRALQQKTGVPPARTCFFDDQSGNVADVAALGVHSFLTPNGVTRAIFERALKAAGPGVSMSTTGPDAAASLSCLDRDTRPRKRLSFGSVQLWHFAVILDDSKLPHDGLSPLGLGELQSADEFMLEEYELARASTRRGVRHVDDFERRGLLVGYLDQIDERALAALEVVEAANRQIRGQNVTTYERVDEEGQEADSTWDSLRRDDKPTAVKPPYTTADEGASRDGVGGGFHERDEDAEVRRKARALADKAATDSRKAERRRCAGCKRYACIC